jgi:hypothetical protein
LFVCLFGFWRAQPRTADRTLSFSLRSACAACAQWHAVTKRHKPKGDRPSRQLAHGAHTIAGQQKHTQSKETHSPSRTQPHPTQALIHAAGLAAATEQSNEPEADIAVRTGSAAAARDRYDGWQHLILLLPLPLQPLRQTTKKMQTDNGLTRCHTPQHAYE